MDGPGFDGRTLGSGLASVHSGPTCVRADRRQVQSGLSASHELFVSI